MAQPSVSLFIDVQNRQLVRSFTSTVPALLPVAYQGDTLNLTLRFLQATGVPSAPYTDIDYSAAAVTVAAASLDAKPTYGQFTITDTGASQTTAPLPYNATAAQVQSAIQTGLTTHWSTATVYGGTSGPFTITNGANGAQTLLIGTSLTLEPASSVAVDNLQTGDTDTVAQQLLLLSVNPFALQTSWVASFNPDVLSGTLSLDTSSLELLMSDSPSLCSFFSIKVVPASGSPFTVFQTNFIVKNDLILGAPSAPTPSVHYYTTVESDARYGQGQTVAVERDSTGTSTQHVTVGATSNVLYLISNANDTLNFTFDNGTYDGQTVTYNVASDIGSITYSGNVSGVLNPDSIGGGGATLSFLWDQPNSVWIPI